MTDKDEFTERAANYVLGLMTGEELREAELDMERNLAFREAVQSLSAKFHGLDQTVTAEPVPDRLWPGISERIADISQISRDNGSERRPVIVPAPARRRPTPHSLGDWRGLAIAASLAAACAVGYFGALATTDGREPVVVVVLNTPDNLPGAVFEAYADDSVRIVPLEDFVVPEGQTMQVWTLYDKAVGPVSLGTIGRDATEVRLQGPHLPLPKADQLYEITLEPAPGSPTGKPTGPILVKGFAKQPAGV